MNPTALTIVFPKNTVLRSFVGRVRATFDSIS